MKASQLIRRWAVVVLLGVVSLGCWQAARRGDTQSERIDPVAYPRALQTPLLSARRLPRTLQAPVADAAITPRIQAAAGASPPQSCLLVQAGPRTVSAVRPELALVPASNEKLLTTFVALSVLGGDFRYRTTLRADAPAVNGVINGNLYLVGEGDPFLSSDDWWAQYEDDDRDGRFHTRLEDLVADLRSKGVTQITGSLVGDETLFDTVRQGPWASRLSDQSGPLSALTVNEGYSSWPANPKDNKPRVPADNPALWAATQTARLLAAQGIAVGPPAAGPAPSGAQEVAAVVSPPLTDIITHINSFSSNLGAELLLKRLGKVKAGEGSTRAGAGVVVAQLKAAGVPTDGLRVDDGSGLAETDRVTCRTLAAVLTRAGPDSALASSLSIGATRGSLHDRFVNTPGAGRVHAKTGTLKDSVALSGYVLSATDPDMTLTFVVVANREAIPIEAQRNVQDTLVSALTAWPGTPAVTALAPLATTDR